MHTSLLTEKVMTVLSNGDKPACGSIVFNKDVDIETLKQLARKIKLLGEEDRWVDIHVRSGGDKGVHIVAFHYLLREGDTAKTEADRITDMLKGELGVRTENASVPKGVNSWTMSDTVFVI